MCIRDRLCCIQLISARLGYLVNEQIKTSPYRAYLRPIRMLACAAVAFFVVLGAIVLVRRMEGARALVGALPMATFNTCVLGTMLASATQSFTFGQTMGFALGSGVGYVLAAVSYTHLSCQQCSNTVNPNHSVCANPAINSARNAAAPQDGCQVFIK